MFYYKDQENNYCESPIRQENFIETTELEYNNYILPFKKEEKLLELKKNIEKIFYDTYSQSKQNNIAIYGTIEEKQEFKDFHDRQVALYDEKVIEIESCKSLENLNNIVITF